MLDNYATATPVEYNRDAEFSCRKCGEPVAENNSICKYCQQPEGYTDPVLLREEIKRLQRCLACPNELAAGPARMCLDCTEYANGVNRGIEVAA